MKTLQSDFTTPEQSKRLLELGVPADSADCYYYEPLGERNFIYILQNSSPLKETERRQRIIVHPDTKLYPCWSVGRLVEICLKCSTLEQRQVRFFCNGDDDYYDFMAYTINVLESGIITNHMDFSKLED